MTRHLSASISCHVSIETQQRIVTYLYYSNHSNASILNTYRSKPIEIERERLPENRGKRKLRKYVTVSLDANMGGGGCEAILINQQRRHVEDRHAYCESSYILFYLISSSTPPGVSFLLITIMNAFFF